MKDTRDICFTLHKTMFLIDKQLDALLKSKLSLTGSQFRILTAINHNKNITQKNIADYWEMTEAAVSRQIQLLIDENIIIRLENPENRSKNSLHLSKKGLQTLKQGFAIVATFEHSIFTGDIQKETFTKGLEIVLHKLCPSGGGPCES